MPLQTIPQRDVFINRLMKRYGQSNKGILDLLIDAKDWFERNPRYQSSPISPDVVAHVSIYLRHRYTKTENLIKEELTHYNRTVRKANGK